MYRSLVFSFVALTTLSVFGQPADVTANREHFFPLIATGDGFKSDLFLTNFSQSENRCLLRLQGRGLDALIFEDNDALSVTASGATIDLAGQGDSLTLLGNGERSLVFGYAKLDCEEPVVARILLALNVGASTVAMTSLESTHVSHSFQIPVLTQLGQLGLLFSNDLSVVASCGIELENVAGASTGGGNVSVPAESTVLQFLGDVIPRPYGFNFGTAVVSCNHEILAVGLLLNEAIFTAMPAIHLESEITAQATKILPLIVDGGGFRSHLLATNLADSANKCTLNLYGEGLSTSRFEITDGASFADSSVTLEFTAKGDQLVMSSTGGQDLAFGHAALECDQPISAQNLLSVGPPEEPVSMAAIDDAQLGIDFKFPIVPLTTDQLALILSRSAGVGASCTVGLVNSSGSLLFEQATLVPRQSTSVKFLSDLFSIPDDFTSGALTVNCDHNLTAVLLPLSGSVFAAAPPSILSASVIPRMVVIIPDSNLRTILAVQLGKEADEEIYANELTALQTLNAENARIDSLEGLQYATELKILDLGPAQDSNNRDVNSNQISDITQILELSNLTFLDLRYNNLSGSIPQKLAELSELQYLYLSANQFAGDIPEELGQLVDLKRLSLRSNLLTGGIPTELSNLRDLTHLWIGFNQLSGVIPAELSNLLDLQYMHLGGNELTGAIPAELGELINLESLYLFQNQLNYSIPGELGRLAKLRHLSLRRNNLTGTIPPQLGQLDHLEVLALDNNQFTGGIPPELSNLSSVRFLNLSHNNISAIIPPELGELIYLETLALNSNEITGNIPAELGQLENLESLVLSTNQLTGSIPPELGQLQNLKSLHLSSNQLNGAVPPELGKLATLEQLSLGHNQLSGAIPDDFSHLSELNSLDLYNNQFTGNIPLELGSLVNLQSLSLGDNQLTGNIPSELGQLSNLRYLRLQRNQLTGSVPLTLGSLPNLRELDISFNELTDISQLALNDDLGSGITIDLRGNPLNDEAYDIHIPALIARGVEVKHD